MNIYQAEREAQDLSMDHDKIVFMLVGPTGSRPCVWLDPHMGMFQLADKHGNASGGFIMTRDAGEAGLWVEDQRPVTEDTP